MFVTASCDAGDQAQLFVTLSQASGKRLVQGTGALFGSDVGGQFVCDGTPQLVPVTIGVSTAPLKQGKAAVTASLGEFGPATPTGAGVSVTSAVTLRK